MTKRNIMVWGFSFAGVLMAVTGLRDLFAPGLASMSPRIPTTGDVSPDRWPGAHLLQSHEHWPAS